MSADLPQGSLSSASSLEKAQATEAGPVNTQTAEIVLLLTAPHEVVSYNGDLGVSNSWAPLAFTW